MKTEQKYKHLEYIQKIMESPLKNSNAFNELQNMLEYLNTPNFDNQYDSDVLTNIMSKYNSDKGYGLCNHFRYFGGLPPNNIVHNYTYFYHMLFRESRFEFINIFEMGVGVPPSVGSWGGSLLGWKEYFPNSKIYSADIDANYLYNDDRIHSYYVDQEDGESIKQMWNNLDLENISFDIILDDGPHTYISNYLFYRESIQKLKFYGIYIIEDINLDFIDDLFEYISKYNDENGIKYKIQKLIIPYPRKFQSGTSDIMKMNNLIFIQKLP